MEKKRISKKGMSVVIGYVLLVTFGIIMGGIVYTYLKSYVPSEIDKCPDGVSLFVKDFTCVNNQLNLTIKNNGKFNLQGYFIHATNNSNQTLATINLAKYFNALLSGDGVSNNASIYFKTDPNEDFSPGDIANEIFSNVPAIYSIELTPVRIQKIGGTERLVSCGSAKISEVLTCS